MGKRPPTSVYVMLEQRQCMSARSRDKCMIVHVCVKTLWVLTVTDGDEEEQDSWDLKLIQHPNNGLSWREGFDSLWLRQEAENNTLTCFIKLGNAVPAPVSPSRSHRLYARHPCSGMWLKRRSDQSLFTYDWISRLSGMRRMTKLTVMFTNNSLTSKRGLNLQK